MTTDDLYLGPVPSDEKCEQVGPNCDYTRMRNECGAYVQQLARMHGNPPDGAQFVIKREQHDFGMYMEVVIRFDPENEAASKWAYKVENNTPERWDDEARRVLSLTAA